MRVSVRLFTHGVLGLTKTGELWAWGADVNGSLADGAVQTYAYPRSVSGLKNVTQVATSWIASFALDSSGNVFWWGDAAGGMAGRGTWTPSSTYFLRVPDYAGLNFWISQFRSGTTLDAISTQFAQSTEFATRYGSLSDVDFVSLVYKNVLGRPPDAAGAAFWANQLTTGAKTRGQMMTAFSASAEYVAVIDSQVYVTMIYAGMLRRAPDKGGFSFWVNQLDGGVSPLALINGFVDAAEYRSRFLP